MNDNNYFYDVSRHILDKYRHLVTPYSIIKEMEKTISDTDSSKYGVNIDTNESEFLKDSLKYSTIKGYHAPYVPLHSYWTTFSSLDSNQRNYYFYWRGQVLEDIYLDTDMSYIILFTYELLNYSFNPEASFNASMLEKIYLNYKDRHPKLKNYLPLWLSDFLFELEEYDLSKEWDFQQQTIRGNYGLYQQLQLKDIDKIPLSVWKTYMPKHRESDFFKKHRDEVYRIFQEVLIIFKEDIEKEVQDLTEHWFDKIKVLQKKYLFKSAVIVRKTKVSNVEVEEIKTNSIIYDQILNILRLSENVVRKLNGINRDVALNEEFLPISFRISVLTRYGIFQQKKFKSLNRFNTVQQGNFENGSFIPKPNDKEEKTATFNWGEFENEIEKLKTDSEELEKVFQDNDEEVIESSNDFFEKEIKENRVIEQPSSEETQEMPSIFGTTNEDIDFEGFVDSLDDNEKEFLKQFVEAKITVKDATSFARSKGLMISVLIDQINEKSDEFLEDVLIEKDGEEYEIYEEFLEVLNILGG